MIILLRSPCRNERRAKNILAVDYESEKTKDYLMQNGSGIEIRL